MTLDRARFLVADDQRDVAITLTAELRRVGAALTYATDGEEALRKVQAGGIDVVLLDMKMPPGDWGGLWFLNQIRELGLTVPVIALSGEGGQRQTIEAMRLGARDWVDKGAAGRELLERCSRLLSDVRQGALEAAARLLPSPVAHDLGRYAKASEYGRAVKEGLRALESTVKFAALLALAARPEDARRMIGVQAAQFARPSLGTWLSVARGLVDIGDHDAPATTCLAALMPDRRSVTVVQDLVTLRNEIAHGGHDATESQSDTLRNYLVDGAHRLSTAWPWQLHVVTSMEYDGTSFTVRTRLYAGSSGSTPSTFISPSPLRTREVVLLEPNGRLLRLSPWLVVVEVNGKDAVGIYDTAPLPKGDNGTEAPLQYADPESRLRGLVACTTQATWSQVRHHFDRS